jgi:hypothetical protein
VGDAYADQNEHDRDEQGSDGGFCAGVGFAIGFAIVFEIGCDGGRCLIDIHGKILPLPILTKVSFDEL